MSWLDGQGGIMDAGSFFVFTFSLRIITFGGGDVRLSVLDDFSCLEC